MSTDERIPGARVPQAPLASVRKIVDALLRGAVGTDELARETDIEHRHVSYALRAAETLGLVSPEGELTELGKALASTIPKTHAERHLFRHAAAGSALLHAIMPDVLSEEAPPRALVVARLLERTTLGAATAARRATDLLSWRRFLVEDPPAPAQLQLKFARGRAKPAVADDAPSPPTDDTPSDDDDELIIPDIAPENTFPPGDDDVPF